MAKEIWVIAEQKGEKIKKASLEMISLVRKMGHEVTVLMLGHGIETLANTLGQYGADKVLVFDDPVLQTYSSDIFTKVICDAVRDGNPNILLGPATSSGKDYLPKVAARLKTGLASDCIDLNVENDMLIAVRPVYAGKCLVEAEIPGSTPQMASIRPNVFGLAEPDVTRSVEIIKKEVDLKEIKSYSFVKEIIEATSKKVDLSEASIIISGGRAMKNSDNFKILWDLADVLGSGATVGASRAAVDSGYATHDMQIGQTGKVVNPQLYIACGVSGAIQHLAGMRNSKMIVAINKDPEAPIFQNADYGIIGDLFEIVPKLTEELKQVTSHN